MAVRARAKPESASMKIGIVSDRHDCAAMLQTAVADTKAQGAEAAIHRNVIGGNTLRPLRARAPASSIRAPVREVR